MRKCSICGKSIKNQEFKNIPEFLIPNLCYHHYRTISRMQKEYIKNSVPNNIDLLVDDRRLPRNILDNG